MCLARVTARPLRRQTIWCGRVALEARVASSFVTYLDWQESYFGGRDEFSHETRFADCPGAGDICRGNRGRFAARAQHAGTEPLRPAKNGAACGGVQIQR